LVDYDVEEQREYLEGAGGDIWEGWCADLVEQLAGVSFGLFGDV
jgi:hypothetical protein